MKKESLNFLIIILSISIIGINREAAAQTLPSVAILGAANIEALSNTSIQGVEGAAIQSRAGALAVYNSANGLACATTISGTLDAQVLDSSSSLSVICINGPAVLNGTLTINAPPGGIVVVRIPGNLTLGGGGQIAVGNADPNTVFYQVNGNVSLGANSLIQGTVLATGNITADPTASVNGRLLSLNGVVVANPENIDCPSCIATSTFGNISIHKTVINDNGGMATSTDFEFFIGGVRVNPYTPYAFVPGTYILSELSTTGNYLSSSWGGNCSANGTLNLAAGESAVCNITNNDLGSAYNPPTTTPIATPIIQPPSIPNTGGRMVDLYIVLAILGGTLTGFYLIKRGIKSLNQ